MNKIAFIISFLTLFSCSKISDPSNTPNFTHSDFTESENHKINRLLDDISNKTRIEFEKKYEVWEKTWDWERFASCSNPKCWTQSTQYENLLNYSKTEGKKVWPLVFVKYLQTERDYIGSLLVEDLTLEEYRFLAEQIHEQLREEPQLEYSKFWIYYIKEVLKDL